MHRALRERSRFMSLLFQVLAKVDDIERDGARKVTRFSAVGYSLGGLLARYVLG